MALKRYDTYRDASLPDGTTDEQTPTVNDGGVQPVQPVGPAPYQPVTPGQQREPASQKPSLSGGGSVSVQPVQPKTFAQMQQEGLARPPQPTMANMSFAPADVPGISTVGGTGGATMPNARLANPTEAPDWASLSPQEQSARVQAYNRQTAQDDARGNIDSIKKAGGVYQSQGDEDKAFQEFMRQAGFDPSGAYTGEPQNNPNATPGFPANYDPSKPGQPAGGYVDDQGVYHSPDEQGPPRYVINGQWFDNPQGKGQPLGVGPSSAGGTGVQTPPGTTSGGTSGGTGGGAGGGAGGGTGSTTGSSTFDLLDALIKGSQGQGAGSGVQSATEQALLKLLQNPNPYGAQDVKDQYSWLGGQIDDQYALQQQRLGEEMARRGLGNSTNYGGRLQDLNIGQRSAKASMAQDLAHQFAQNYGNTTLGAIGLGNTVGTQAQQNQQNWLAQLMGYGQQAFNNDLATNAMNQNAAQQWQNYILGLLGYGGGG